MIITLCGSARFEEEFHQYNERLTLMGHVVISLAVFPSRKREGKDWFDAPTKLLLDNVHKQKVSVSDAIVVLNVGGYIGDSTSSEIQWARITQKTIYWLEPPGPERRINMRGQEVYPYRMQETSLDVLLNEEEKL